MTKHRPNRRPNFSMLYSTKKTYRNKNGVGAFPMGGVAETRDRFVTLTGCRLDNVLNSVITTRSLLVSSALAMCLFLGCGDSAMPKRPTSATASAPQIQHTEAHSSSPTRVRTFTSDNRKSALVTKVIDGDTVEVSLEGELQP